MKKLFLGVALLGAVVANAQTADEIINKHIEALGGKANIEKIQSLIMEGSMDAMGNKIDIKTTKVAGKLNRQDISAMGSKAYAVTTDTSGWVFFPFMGQTAPEALTGDVLKAAQQELSIVDELYDYSKKGMKVEVNGKEDVAGTECHKLKVTAANGETSTIYVDPTTWMITRKQMVKKVMGQDFPAVMDYSDYKVVEGVKFPFTMGTPQGTMVFTIIKANQAIDAKAYSHE